MKTSVPQTGNAPEAAIKAPRTIGQGWYSAYYAAKGADRNSLLENPEVLFQLLAQDAALVRALQRIKPNPLTARVLDIGCGEGASLCSFLRLGFLPRNLYGVDFQAERIDAANQRFSNVHFVHGDATDLQFPTGDFDLVTETTMFIHSVDDELSRQIASEMIRVTRPGGYILLTDWRYGKPGSAAHKAVTQRRIRQLFGFGRETIKCGTFGGPLIPPVGRFLSSHWSSIYFLVRAWFPFLVAQTTTVLRKATN
jgi:SAM-dependent methyltransferase